MNTIVIPVHEDFVVSDIINNLQANEWEIILTYISELLSSYGSNISNITKETIEANIRHKYTSIIENLNRKVESHNEYCEDLKKEHNLKCEQLEDKMNRAIEEKQQAWNNSLQKQLTSQRNEMNNTFKAELRSKEEAYLQLTLRYNNITSTFNAELKSKEESFAQLKSLYDNHLINSKAELELQKKDIINKHNIELEKKDVIINNITSNHNDEIAKYKNILELQKKSIIEEYNRELENRNAEIKFKNESYIRLKSLYDEVVNDHKHNIELQKKSITEEYNRELEKKDTIIKNINNSHNDEITKIKNTLESQKKDIINKYIDELNNKNAEIKSKEADLELQKKSIIDSYTFELNNKDRIIKNITEAHTDELAKLKSISESNLENQKKNIIDKYIGELNNKDAEIKSKNDAYIQLESICNNKIANIRDTYELQKKSIIDKYILELEKKDISIKNINDVHNDELNNMKKKLDMIESEISQKYESHYNAKCKMMTDELNVYKELHQQAEKKYEQFSMQMNKSTVQKGKDGEDAIMRILLSPRYDESIVENTSGETAKGDIYFKWKRLKCLIEVKNKQTLSLRDDMEKFVRDVSESHQSERRINCAVFISLLTDIFPKRPRQIIQLDYINGVPVVYVYLDNDATLHCVLTLLDQLLSVSGESSDMVNELKSNFIKCFTHINSECKFYDKLIKDKKKEINALCLRRDEAEQLYNMLQCSSYKYIDHNVFDDDEKNTTVSITNINNNVNNNSIAITLPTPTQVVIDPNMVETKQEVKSNAVPVTSRLFKTHYVKLLERGLSPTLQDMCQHFNVTEAIVKNMGGYEALTTEALTEHVQNFITPDIQRQLNEMKTKLGRFPNRKEINDSGLITEAELRKFGKVVKKTRVISFIEQYCDANHYE